MIVSLVGSESDFEFIDVERFHQYLALCWLSKTSKDLRATRKEIEYDQKKIPVVVCDSISELVALAQFTAIEDTLVSDSVRSFYYRGVSRSRYLGEYMIENGFDSVKQATTTFIKERRVQFAGNTKVNQLKDDDVLNGFVALLKCDELELFGIHELSHYLHQNVLSLKRKVVSFIKQVPIQKIPEKPKSVAHRNYKLIRKIAKKYPKRISSYVGKIKPDGKIPLIHEHLLISSLECIVVSSSPISDYPFSERAQISLVSGSSLIKWRKLKVQGFVDEVGKSLYLKDTLTQGLGGLLFSIWDVASQEILKGFYIELKSQFDLASIFNVPSLSEIH